MPGGDRTGPMGSGSMTGRGAGYCAGFQKSGYANAVFGCGLAQRKGRRWGADFQKVIPNDVNGVMTSKEEVNVLKHQASFFKRQMDSINTRIREI